jgi:hypothetical protein
MANDSTPSAAAFGNPAALTAALPAAPSFRSCFANVVTNLVRTDSTRTNVGWVSCTWLAHQWATHFVETQISQIKSMRSGNYAGLGMRRAMQHGSGIRVRRLHVSEFHQD